MSLAKKGKPPQLQQPPKEDSIDKLDVNISEHGTLRLNILGKDVEVRSWGAHVPDEAKEQEQALFGKIKWSELKKGHVIGEGTQAKVRKVKYLPTGELYALKVIPLNKHVTKRQLQSEISRVVTSANHPNVVKSEEAFYIDGALKILMEFCELGTLARITDIAGVIPEDALSCMTRQLLHGLEYLHAQEIVHRDLKPSNLLCRADGNLKISDFGVCAFVNSVNPFAVTVTGSTAYMSPERVKATPYDKSSDIWSVGLTIAQCACGVFPILIEGAVNEEGNPFAVKPNMFDLATIIADNRAKVDFDDLIQKIKTYLPNKPVPVISDCLKNFVWICMEQDPKLRPDCKSLLQHEFITKYSYYTEAMLSNWLKSLPQPQR